MPQGRIKARPEDAETGKRLYIRIQSQWHQVEVCGTKPSPKGVKVEYRMEDGTQGAQLLTSFYRLIPEA